MLRELKINEMEAVSGGLPTGPAGPPPHPSDPHFGRWLGNGGAEYLQNNSTTSSEHSFFEFGSGDVTGDCCDWSLTLSEDGLSARLSANGSIDAFSFRVTGEDISEGMRAIGRWLYENGGQAVFQGEDGPQPGDSNYPG